MGKSEIFWAFNTSFDHVRILYHPTPIDREHRLVVFDFKHRWPVPEKVVWWHRNEEMIESAVQSITVRYDAVGILGMCFQYASGFERGIGHLFGAVDSFHFNKNERLEQFVVGHSFVGGVKFLSVST
jgi:hypothetical protein